MRIKRSRAWTVLVIPSNGSAVRTLSLPAWVSVALHSWLLCTLCAVGFTGWQLQARFGLHGWRAVQLAAFHDRAERWGFYEKSAPTIEESTNVALRRRAAKLRALQLELGNRTAASALLAGNVAPEWIDEARRGPSFGGTLLWPVREGVYGRGFGSGLGGYHLAIDIDGPRGTEVMAAAAGVVGYAGNELRGYGRVVMLVHPGGWVTLYGHNQKLLVVPGEHVRRGQPIAELGSTGRSMGPHVHFELIHNGRNCDPLPLFRPDVPNVPGYLGPIRTAVWLPDQIRPKAVRCARKQDHPRPKLEPQDKLAPDDDAPEPLLSLSTEARISRTSAEPELR